MCIWIFIWLYSKCIYISWDVRKWEFSPFVKYDSLFLHIYYCFKQSLVLVALGCALILKLNHLLNDWMTFGGCMQSWGHLDFRITIDQHLYLENSKYLVYKTCQLIESNNIEHSPHIHGRLAWENKEDQQGKIKKEKERRKEMIRSDDSEWITCEALRYDRRENTHCNNWSNFHCIIV